MGRKKLIGVNCADLVVGKQYRYKGTDYVYTAQYRYLTRVAWDTVTFVGIGIHGVPDKYVFRTADGVDKCLPPERVEKKIYEMD